MRVRQLLSLLAITVPHFHYCCCLTIGLKSCLQNYTTNPPDTQGDGIKPLITVYDHLSGVTSISVGMGVGDKFRYDCALFLWYLFFNVYGVTLASLFFLFYLFYYIPYMLSSVSSDLS